jgi:RimJ/RimL family protein N-acetyltransferase
MIDASRYRVEESLRNGLVITVRAARPDDRERIAKAFAKLKRESVYTRFFSYKDELSPADFARLETMDFVRDVMLVATIPSDADETVIASARYVAAEDLRTAEVAFLVEEDYHGLGIASRLLRHLIAIAREHGIRELEAEVLSGNKAMLAVFGRCGLSLEQRSEGGVTYVTLALPHKGEAVTRCC